MAAPSYTEQAPPGAPLRAERDPFSTVIEDDEPALGMTEEELLQLLRSYFEEARMARETGYEPRNAIWDRNLDAFWQRRDYSDKKAWQAQETTPAVPNFVERFAAVNREALTMQRNWAEIKDLADPTDMLSQQHTRFLRILLDKSGTNTTGHPVAFEKTFGEVLKTGMLMGMGTAVTWKSGRTHAELVDPRELYFDPTGRGLYRCRHMERDKGFLLKMAEMKDSEGEPLYDKEKIKQAISNWESEMRDDKDRATGGSSQTTVRERHPLVINEWLCTLVSPDGEFVRENQLIVTINNDCIIRGPEKNPFWHQRDWIVYHPVLSAPLGSPYGKTYVENFVRVAETFENLTNMILDAVQMHLNAFEVWPERLAEGQQLSTGIFPNMTILRDEESDSEKPAIQPIELGRPLPADLFRVWQGMKGELQEAGAQSDVSLGRQVSGDTTATEVNASRAGQTSLINTVSQDIDTGYLAPVAWLIFMTGVQNIDDQSHPEITALVSPEYLAMLMAKREEFRTRPMQVQAHGISSVIERGQKLRGLMGALNVIGGNPLLIQAFQQEYSLAKLIREILTLAGVEMDRIKMSEREKLEALQQQMRAQIMQQLAGAGAQAGGVTSQNQGGPDPMTPVEGLPGDVTSA